MGSQRESEALRRPPAALAPAAHQATIETERRQVTVLFCDLVGSTELSTQLDPEELHDVMRAFQETCASVVRRFDGRVVKYVGDAALVLFGFPLAHEDDPHRAVRTGLGIVEAVEQLDSRLERDLGVRLSVRVGIHTGLVVAGEMGTDGVRNLDVVGETPNVAARLQALARPDTVVISDATRRLTAGSFDLEGLGLRSLKGIAGPVELWRVLDARARTPFEARVGDRLSPLVGRQTELDLLLDAWRTSQAGNWRSMLIVGEAGIGKSRLVQELIEQTASADQEVLRLQCSPYHVATALLPFVDWIRSVSGIELGADAGTVQGQLEALVDRFGFEREATVPLLAPLLALPLGEWYEPPRLSLTLQRRRTVELVIELIKRTAEARPLLIAVEDVHAADPTSLELLTHLVEGTGGVSGLLVMTARPAFATRFQRRQLGNIDLEPLTMPSTLALVDELTGGKPLPGRVRNTIVGSSDGVPLFVEELTRQLLESPALRDAGDRYELDADLAVTVPATLHDLLVARLDSLGPAKVTAQVASTLGRSFSLELLRAVAPASGRDLADDVGQLCAARILDVADDEPAATRYAFRHALLREAAYHAQLKARRRKVHLAVARVLEERYPSVVESEPETLAHHFTEGGEREPAADYLLRAGRKALHASAVHEAITHLSNGLELIAGLAHTAARDRMEMRLQALLGTAYMHAKSWGASEVEAAYSRAARLSDAAETAGERVWVLWGSWVYRHVRGRVEDAYEAAGRIRELAATTRDADAELIGDMVALQSGVYTGRFSEALDHCESFLEAYEADRHRSLAEVYSADLELVCLLHQAIASWIVGRPGRAGELSRRVENLVRQIDHPYSVAWGSTWGAVPDLLRGDTDRATERVLRGHRIAEEHDYAYVAAMAKMLEGWLDGRRGDAQGVDAIETGLAAFQATGAEIVVPFFQTLRSELLVEHHRPDEALALLEDARARIARWGERWQEAEVSRVEAKALAAGGAMTSDVEARFGTALDLARRQGAHAWQLRAATDFASYLCEQRRPDEARGVLKPALEAFAGAGESEDVVRAARILAAANDQLLVG